MTDLSASTPSRIIRRSIARSTVTSTAIPVIRLADGCVERLVMNVEDPRPSGRSKLDRGREFPDQQLLDEVVNLLPVCDAGERGVLSADFCCGAYSLLDPAVKQELLPVLALVKSPGFKLAESYEGAKSLIDIPAGGTPPLPAHGTSTLQS